MACSGCGFIPMQAKEGCCGGKKLGRPYEVHRPRGSYKKDNKNGMRIPYARWTITLEQLFYFWVTLIILAVLHKYGWFSWVPILGGSVRRTNMWNSIDGDKSFLWGRD